MLNWHKASPAEEEIIKEKERECQRHKAISFLIIVCCWFAAIGVIGLTLLNSMYLTELDHTLLQVEYKEYLHDKSRFDFSPEERARQESEASADKAYDELLAFYQADKQLKEQEYKDHEDRYNQAKDIAKQQIMHIASPYILLYFIFVLGVLAVGDYLKGRRKKAFNNGFYVAHALCEKTYSRAYFNPFGHRSARKYFVEYKDGECTFEYAVHRTIYERCKPNTELYVIKLKENSESIDGLYLK
ncbi:MAG: hypothetical protein IJR47_00795 [Clostridia bacterium]|nr:hypothetical protein [Clostridia bacterium]